MTTNNSVTKDSISKSTSPCVRNCCLNQEDICLGCFRHLNEITRWRELTEVEQRQILIKCEQRKVTSKP
ncbi:DUF1289 domain-containing protein [Thalassotalea piscium]